MLNYLSHKLIFNETGGNFADMLILMSFHFSKAAILHF